MYFYLFPPLNFARSANFLELFLSSNKAQAFHPMAVQSQVNLLLFHNCATSTFVIFVILIQGIQENRNEFNFLFLPALYPLLKDDVAHMNISWSGGKSCPAAQSWPLHYGFSYHFSGNGTFFLQINIVTSIFIENC